MPEIQPLRVGVLGCGNIAKQYFKAAGRFHHLEMVACADLRREAAEAAAKEFNVPDVMDVDALIAAENVDCILNLTIPAAHVEMGRRAIAAGKHVYGEKPLGIDRDEGAELIRDAEAAGKRVGTAPDTFLGAGQQTARKAIDDGLIGEPLHFTAQMLSGGTEAWHPNPKFFYEVGGGPMFDMGPYYLTALVHLFGSIDRVAAFTDKKIPTRTITHDRDMPGSKHGQTFDIEIPDHHTGIVRFDAGVTGTLTTSFATKVGGGHDWRRPITVYGTEGALQIPDPNVFDRTVRFKGRGDDEFRDLPYATPEGYGRAVGLADMAQAIATGRDHRCSGDLGQHVLDAMASFLDSGERGEFIAMSSTVERPTPLPAELPDGLLD
ncbi:Gfo/Idh/MocA family protein [Phycisphaera mikurensis]|uniref:Oxidoreductase n=1 Tax=Phycisphaera mikurensis (strain NBRC 102666 / KCTC 22515 / FYK2301M01) TaxID=1142394 RepID=I0IFY5_PHYMF|nr:Gfo/Idh/MocA family oxidoreductase [Phycisphaera mikurensis]MBB6440441.1 putative dehydrogenase [Phycisphaera mikurensis]BAM04173.1 hypothetical protein PSMK_20140 [Phycisphaera mikurensis NBRC 102666]